MQRLAKSVVFCFVVIAAFFSNGCIDKTIYPSTELQVTKVLPYALIPTATDTASLPTTVVSVRSQSKIPCTLKSMSARFYTAQGEEIPLLSVSNQEAEIILDAEGQVDITVRPYSSVLVDLFELSASQISPVKAQITLHFYDINGNWVNVDAHCLLYKFTAEPAAANRRAL